MYALRPLPLLLMFALLSCVSVEFVRTGEEHPPLPGGTEVKVLDAKASPGGYAEIGLLTIRGGSEAKRLGRAKEEALKRGGNGVLPRGTKMEPSAPPSSGKSAETKAVQEFLVVRLTEEGQIERPVVPGVYGELPRAGYRELLDNSEALKEKKFQGALIPVNFYRVPRALKKYDDGSNNLLLVATRSGKSSLLLFVPKTMEGDIRGMIAKRQLLGFVYSPLGVYSTKKGQKYPVLKMIDRIDGK